MPASPVRDVMLLKSFEIAADNRAAMTIPMPANSGLEILLGDSIFRSTDK